MWPLKIPFPASCCLLVVSEASAASLNWLTKVSMAAVRRPSVAKSLLCKKHVTSCSFKRSCLIFIFFFSLSHTFPWPASLWPWRSSSPDSRDGCPGPKKSSVTATLFALLIGSVNSGHLLLLLQSLFGSLLFFPDVIYLVKGFAQKENSPKSLELILLCDVVHCDIR